MVDGGVGKSVNLVFMEGYMSDTAILFFVFSIGVIISIGVGRHQRNSSNWAILFFFFFAVVLSIFLMFVDVAIFSYCLNILKKCYRPRYNSEYDFALIVVYGLPIYSVVMLISKKMAKEKCKSLLHLRSS